MEAPQGEGGEAQQKEETSKRHTYPLIRVCPIFTYNL